MNVYCQLGLGNRIATIAAAIAKFGDIVFHWCKTRDLASDVADVFPDGCAGVRFVDCESGTPSTGINGKMGYDFHDFADYVETLRWVAGKAHSDVEFAIHGRFHRNTDCDPVALVGLLPSDADKVFVMTDAHRGAICSELRRRGITPILPMSREMGHDFDREITDTLPFLSDWKTLCGASVVVTNCIQSSALHPLRQLGAKLITT